MIVYNDATSPFGRKVVVWAWEIGIPVDEVFVDLSNATHLDRYNPLRQIPVLVTNDDVGIYDSQTILSFLDDLAPEAQLLPASRHIDVLTRCALADGLMEATLTRLIEARRPDEQRSSAVIEAREARIHRSIAALESDVDRFAPCALAADHFAVACALGYVDFRYDGAWRDQAPNLSAWYEAIAARPSLVATVPTRTTPAKANLLEPRG